MLERRGSEAAQLHANFVYRQVSPVLAVVVEGAEAAGFHAIDVEGAIQVVDLVLQDAGVPAGGFDHAGRGQDEARDRGIAGLSCS